MPRGFRSVRWPSAAGAANAALLAADLAVHDAELHQRLSAWRQAQNR
jgi:phosphoribosylcarboxyaminoimidazole (NCAIR) mutase